MQNYIYYFRRFGVDELRHPSSRNYFSRKVLRTSVVACVMSKAVSRYLEVQGARNRLARLGNCNHNMEWIRRLPPIRVVLSFWHTNAFLGDPYHTLML